MKNFRKTLFLALALVLGFFALSACRPTTPLELTPTPESGVALTQTVAAEQVAATAAAPTSAPPTPLPQIGQANFEGVSFSYNQAAIAEAQPSMQPARLWAPVDVLFTEPISETLPGVPPSIIIELIPAAGAAAQPSALVVHAVRNSGQVYPSISRSNLIFPSLERLQSAVSAGAPPTPFFAGDNPATLEARVRRIDFQNGTGFAALTHLTAPVGPDPITSDGLAYVYHGLTRDGNYYVALRFPISAAALDEAAVLAEAPTWAGDPAAYGAYVAQVTQSLEALPAEAFTPDLRMLDSLIASLRVEPTLPLPPTAEATPACADRAQFVSETVPDGTVFQPGETVQKTWTLTNAGTCAWTPEYRLVQTGGATLGYSNDTPLPLGQTVEPGRSTEITVNLTAPQAAGDYEAQFMLENLVGDRFGLGADGETPIWVRFSVLDLQSNLDLGVPDFLDDFEADRNYWFLNQGEDIGFAISDGKLVITAFSPVGDRWRTANRPPLADFYIEMDATTGPACSAKDSYGFILRAPAQEDNVVDSGYVFGFSCDGMFRFYRMDNGSFALIQNWTPVPQLRPGPNATNLIGVRADGDVLDVFVNGEQIASFEEYKYYLGLYGFMIRAESEADFQVLIDRLAYWELP